MTTALSKEPIPSGVYYSAEHHNFYAKGIRRGMGIVFFKKWAPRWKEFPSYAACDNVVTP